MLVLGKLITGRLVLSLFASLVVAGLLLPVYGPLISSSYAELLPEHDHVMLDGIPNHTHSSDGGEISSGADALSLPGIVADGAVAVVIATGGALLALWAYLPAPPALRCFAARRTPALCGAVALRPSAPPPKAILSITNS